MNLLGIQIIGLIVGFVMIFLTYYSYRKKEFVFLDFSFWFLVWFGFTLAVIFPTSLKGFLQTVGVVSVVQLFSILGMIVIFILVFFLYKVVKKNNQQVQQIVEELALKKVK